MVNCTPTSLATGFVESNVVLVHTTSAAGIGQAGAF
jgi:hypothetical protein